VQSRSIYELNQILDYVNKSIQIRISIFICSHNHIRNDKNKKVLGPLMQLKVYVIYAYKEKAIIHMRIMSLWFSC